MMALNTASGSSRPLAIVRHPVYPALLPIPILCFIGTVVTDLAYASSADMMWLDFSCWLLLAGLIAGGVAGLILIIEWLRAGRARSRALTVHLLLALAAWVVAVFNSFVHARDGWTAVVPTGMTLSIAGAILGILAGWVWQSASRRMTGAIR